MTATSLVQRPSRDARRGVLRRAGLAGGVLVVSGLGYRVYDQSILDPDRGPAYRAWEAWDEGTGAMALVRAAVLAASPHNSQPWTFYVHGDDAIDLVADRSRATGVLDALGRELHVGLGCALENLMQAAPAHGLNAKLTLLPEPDDPDHVAHVALSPGPTRRAALYRAIPDRHTDRSAFAPKTLTAGQQETLTQLAHGLPDTALHVFTAPDDLARIGALMVDAARAVTHDPAQSRAGFALFRSEAGAIARHKDGLTLDAQGMSAALTALVKLLPPTGRHKGDAFWVQQTRDVHTKTAAAYGMVLVRDARDDRARLQGGRLLERAHLWTTANGLALHHMNQITERVDREAQLHLAPRFTNALQNLVPDGWQALATFRLGHPGTHDGRRRSPRRPAEDVTSV